MSDANPWVTRPVTAAPDEPLVAPPVGDSPATVTGPQPGVPVPDQADRLPRRQTGSQAAVWWVGVHGGAGESTLAALAAGTRAAGHAWPMPSAPGMANQVVLVARTNHAGLTAAQRAATEWAAGTLGEGIRLAGLVLVADGPGRRPRALRSLEQIVAGGVPRVWTLPWVEAWRVGPMTAEALPREHSALFSDLSLTTTASSL